MILPPKTEQELQQRVNKLAGLNLSQLAHQAGVVVPPDLQHNKGWSGQLLELILGCDAKNRSEPDFVQLGIELKTLPLKSNGQPAETTYVCMVPLNKPLGLSWEHSCVYKKLNRVLWLPLEGERSIPVADRRIGQGFIWSPSVEQIQKLKKDWEELMEFVGFGELDIIDAGYGDFLQIRPKGPNSKARTHSIGRAGENIQTLPRGFYLRTSFTRSILSAELSAK